MRDLLCDLTALALSARYAPTEPFKADANYARINEEKQQTASVDDDAW